MRDGRALTPMALLALWVVPEEATLTSAYDRGVDFVAQAGADPPAYPVYTLSASLLVLSSPRNARHADKLPALADAIRRLQREDGGWAYLDEPANLSSTLFAAGAMRLAGAPSTDPALVRARGFVERCQNFAGEGAAADPRFDDGGFFFSPELADGNKAGEAGRDASGKVRFRSYGSMTADGVRALLRLGAAPTDARVAAARRWLVGHYAPQETPGDFPPGAELRRASNYYYWMWSGAHAMRALGERAWAAPHAETLLAQQQADGTWRNRSMEMREDDPLIATPFAMAGLAVARTVLTGELRSHAADARR